ncbi:unnamed protein product, partial [Amoebophrya sp. A120]
NGASRSVDAAPTYSKKIQNCDFHNYTTRGVSHVIEPQDRAVQEKETETQFETTYLHRCAHS